MLLDFVDDEAFARTAASLAGLGTATTLAPKVRIEGAYLLSGAPTGSNIFQVANETRTAIRMQLACANASGTVYLAWTGPGSSNPSLSLVVPAASLSAAAYYVVHAEAGPGGCSLRLAEDDDTEIDSTTGAGVTVSNNGAANGWVHLGATTTIPAGVGAIDGIALYSQTPPANASAPAPSDAGILWGVLDDMGNIVPAATDLDNLSGASWAPGGAWDPPADPVVVAPARIDAAAVVSSPAMDAGTAPVTVVPARMAAVASVPAPRLVDSADVVWGVLGDSNTDPYNGDDQRPANNWTEMVAEPSTGSPVLVHHRNMRLGPWVTRPEPRRTGYEWVFARSGSTMVDVLADQLAALVALVAAGEVTHVVLFGTGNEWGNPFQDQYIDRIYNSPDGGVTDANGFNIVALMDALAGRYITSIDDVVAAGAGGMVVVEPPRWDLFPILQLTYTDATRRGYIADAVEYVNGLIDAHIASVNSAAGRTVVVGTTLDALWRDAWLTDDGTHVTIAGVDLIYTSDAQNGEPHYFSIAPQTAIPHPGTIAQGALANTVFAAANQLPGVSIAPFSDAEIRQNAGIYLEADTVAPAMISAAPELPAPTVEITPATVAPERIGASAEVRSPVVAITAGVVQPARVDLPVSVPAPAVLQPTRIAPPRISAAAALLPPSLLEGVPAGVVRATRITAGAAVRDPAVRVSPVTVSPSRISAALQLEAPQLLPGVPGASAVRPARIDAAAWFPEPTVLEASAVVVGQLAVAASVGRPRLWDSAASDLVPPFAAALSVTTSPAALSVSTRPAGLTVEDA